MEDKSDKGTAFLPLPYPTYQFTFIHAGPGLGLTQGKSDLLFGKLGLLHGKTLIWVV